MLHRGRLVQDENSTAPVRSKTVGDTENLGPGWKQPGKGPIRKALGNITNVALRTDQIASSKTPGAIPPPKPRPLGNITNIPISGKPEKTKQSAQSKPAAPAPATKSAIDLLAERYAKDGTERLAGKGWHQLQAEADERETQAIHARVRHLTSIPYRVPLPQPPQPYDPKTWKPQHVPMPQSPVVTPREWPDDSEDLPPSAVVAQLPDVQPGEEWGVDASSSAGSDLSDDHDDDDDDDDSQTSSQADDELQWLRDLDAACQDL